MKKFLKTSDIALAVGVHPNTVRLYEKWGYLPLVPRKSNGYRIYSPEHLEQMRFARIALPGPYPGDGSIVHILVKKTALKKFRDALELACQYKKNIINAEKKALEAVDILEQWSRGEYQKEKEKWISRKKAAAFLHLTIDTIRTWERNNLINIMKTDSGICCYGPEEIGRLKIIYVLRDANYSINAIFRMFRHFDRGIREGLGKVLNTPLPSEDIFFMTDKWITSLQEHKQRADKLISFLQKKI